MSDSALRRTAGGLRILAIAVRFAAVGVALWVAISGFVSGRPVLGAIGVVLAVGCFLYAFLRLRMYRASD
jgi:hypothetical protein